MEKPWLEIPERDGCNRYLAQAWMDSSDSGESVNGLLIAGWFWGGGIASVLAWTALWLVLRGVFA
jgi:hypothetical protein